MNGVDSREVATESFPQSSHERIQACLKNLFHLPTTNLESAFELILGLVKEQSSKIDGLNRARVEAVEGNAKICDVVDGLLKENLGLSADLHKLKEEHCHLLQCHATMSCTLDKLRHEIELTNNLLGGVEGEPHSADEENTQTGLVEVDHPSGVVEVNDIHEGTKIEVLMSGVKVVASSGADQQSENVGATSRRVKEEGQLDDSVKRSLWNAVAKANSERSVADRLHQLEQSLSSFMESTSSKGGNEGRSTERQDEAMEDVVRRINYIETFLHGFEQDHKEAIATVKEDLQRLYGSMTFEEDDESDLATAEDVKGEGPAKSLRQEKNHEHDAEPTPIPGVLRQGQSDTTQLGRNEGDTKIMTIDDRTHHSSASRDGIQQRQVGQPNDVAVEKLGAIGMQIADLRDRLQNQISELAISVKEKVTVRELETRIQEFRNFTSTGSAASSTAMSGMVVFEKEQKILEEISNLKLNMMDKVSYKQQLEQLGQELSKLRLDLSTNVESQRHELKRLCNDDHLPPNGSLIKEETINAKILEATDALRVSLDERIDKVRLIENEMDGFASKLAEKPSQDQIEAMLRNLEKRLGHDVVLQGIMENMNLELKQKMSKDDVVALMKQKIREAKLGMQNTKDALMIGATPSYCLGCGKVFPAGVNGIRAPKMNHDALPLHDAGTRRRVRPLQAFRSVSNVPRPASAIVGAFAPSSTFVHNMHKLP